MTASQATIGIIGGSGLYEMAGVSDLREVWVPTPFGEPSDALMVGQLEGQAVAFLPRHGRGHRHPPHDINYRANVWALKSLGVRWVVSVSAVGSLREGIQPGELVLVDQFIDRTRARTSTFFDQGVVGHVGFGDPCCPVLRQALTQAAEAEHLPFHPEGTYVVIDGPTFSTRAESLLYRSWGADVIGMTNLPEARLAREAQMAYATIAMATDYDCWHESEEAVTVSAVLAVMKKNVERAQRLVRAAIPRIADLPPSPTWSALEHAVMTHTITPEVRSRLGLLLDDRAHHGASHNGQ